MPSKNRIKTYIENGYYHVYNRGVEKRIIFMDDQDYRVFLHLMKRFLSPSLRNAALHPLTEITGFSPKRARPFRSLVGEVQLIAYVLMPNHFHLLLQQIVPDGMTKLMHDMCMMYVHYFNRRQKRVGHLFQEVYKAAWVHQDAYLLHISRYFHATNAAEIVGADPLAIQQYPYSSYGYYLGKKKADWIHPEIILENFKTIHKALPHDLSYQAFTEEGLGTIDANLTEDLLIEAPET